MNARTVSFLLVALLVAFPSLVRAQDLFELQVYPSETADPHRTWFEFHLNGFPRGTRDTLGGQFPNNHQVHFTLEVTHGLTKNWELGGYLVGAYVPDVGPEFVGGRIRPRFRAPASWNLPVGFSLSMEVDNFGVGRGLTGTSEHWIVKCIIGHGFKF